MSQFIFGMLIGSILGFCIFAIFSIGNSEKKSNNPSSNERKGDSNAPK